MFPSVFYTHSCHTSQELGLMGTKSLPCFFRALLLWQWYFPPFSPLSHKHLTILQPTGEQSASRDCYFGFCWPLVGQLCFWLLSWLYSPGDVAFIVWILKDSREEFLSPKSDRVTCICLKCLGLSVTITKQKQSICEEIFLSVVCKLFSLWL